LTTEIIRNHSVKMSFLSVEERNELIISRNRRKSRWDV